MRSISQDLINAGHGAAAQPTAKVEIVNHPFMLSSPMQFSTFATRGSTGPFAAVALDSGNIIIVHTTSGYRLITSPETASQWTSSWTAYPTSGKPANFEALAIAASGDNVQVFARNTSTWGVYVSASSNGGSSFGAWSSIGTPTGPNTNMAGCARYNCVFLRHHAAGGGVALTAIEYVSSWTVYNARTGMADPAPDESRIGVYEDGNTDLVYFSAIPPEYGNSNTGVMVSRYEGGVFGQPYSSLYYMAQEYLREDKLRSVSKLASRDTMVVQTLRAGSQSPQPLFSYRDDFTKYEGQFWMPVAEFDSDEGWWEGMLGWGTHSAETSNFKEGDQGDRATTGDAGGGYYIVSGELDVTLDLSDTGRFTDSDFTTIPVYLSVVDANTAFDLVFFTSTGNYYIKTYTSGSLSTGFQYLYPKRSDFSVSGTPSWANITRIKFEYQTTTASAYAILDYWRTEKADPDNSSAPNPTGKLWNIQPTSGQWAITKDVSGHNASLACFDNQASVEKSAVFDTYVHSEYYIYQASVLVIATDGKAGVWFSNSDISTGSEDGYALILDTSANDARLYRYTAGTPTQIGDTYSVTLSTDTEYYVGIAKIGSTIRCFVSTAQSTLFEYVAIQTTDSNHTLGRCGFVSIGAITRFNDFYLVEYLDTSLESDKTLSYVTAAGVTDQIVFDTNGPRDFMVGDRYAFDIEDSSGVIYRADKVLDATDMTIEDDILKASLSYARESSSTLQAELYNADGRYTDHATLKRGAGARLSLGYVTPVGTEYANMGLFRINRIREQYSESGVAMSLDTIDGNWLLKNWKAQAVHLFQSQNRLFLDFSRQGDDVYLVNVKNASLELAWSELTTASTADAIVLAGDEFHGAVVEIAARTSDSGEGAAGVVFCSDTDGDNLYLVQISWIIDQIQFYQRIGGSWNNIGSTSYTPTHGSYVWLRAMQHHNTLYAWTSSDGITWTYRTSVADTTAPVNTYGHVGIRAVTTTAAYMGIGYFRAYSLKRDITFDDTIRAVATKAGVLDFESEYRLFDDFSLGSVDTDKWRYSERTTATTNISSNRLELADTASSYGYMNSQLDTVDLIVDFKVNMSGSGVMVLVYRMDTTFQNGYRIVVNPGSVGSARVRWYSFRSGTATLLYDYYPRQAIPVNHSLQMRLVVDGDQVSLWMGDFNLLTGSDFVTMTTGYFGLGAYGTASVYYDDVTCFYANAPVDSLAVNIGESGEKICRALAEISSSEYVIEENATMKMGTMLPASGEADVFGSSSPLTFEDQLFEAEVTSDDEEWVTHIRGVGKDGISVDYYDKSDTGIDDLGYRFDVLNYGELDSEDALNLAIQAELVKRKKGIVQRTLVGQVQLACQRGDRITVKIYNIPGFSGYGYRVNGDFVIKSIPSLSYDRKPAPDMSMTLEVEDA